MSFPASSTTKARAWQDICGTALAIRDAVVLLRDKASTGNTALSEYIRLHNRLVGALSVFSDLSQTPGLQAYARDQVSDPTLDLVAEYQAMRTSMVAVRDWIATNGETIGLTVTQAEAAGFITVADAMIATIG